MAETTFVDVNYGDAIDMLSSIWNTSYNETLNILQSSGGTIGGSYATAETILQNNGYVPVIVGGSKTGWTKDVATPWQNIPNSVTNSNTVKGYLPSSTPAINLGNAQGGGFTMEMLTGGQNWQYFAFSALQAWQAAGVGIKLGKVFDGALYNLFPDFFDEHGMSALNPETWNSITRGDDSWGARTFNSILGLNPNTQQMQAYIDADAFAYLASYLYNQNVFASGDAIIPANFGYDGPTPVYATGVVSVEGSRGSDRFRTVWTCSGNCALVATMIPSNTNYLRATAVHWTTNSDLSGSGTVTQIDYIFRNNQWEPYITHTYGGTLTPGYYYTKTYDGKTVYADYSSMAAYTHVSSETDTVSFLAATMGKGTFSPSTTQVAQLSWLFKYGTPTAPDGINDLVGSTPVDTGTWPTTTTIPDLQTILNSLQQQYPDLFTNAITQNEIQPDGSVKTTTYLPIGLPDAIPDIATQPITANTPMTQTNTLLDSTNATDTLTQLILQTVAQLNDNPPDTGDGETPIPVVPTGSASALWSVYHPTQAQVNAFGAWLWTDNIIQQFVQAMNNPMDGIISLHKIFAQPVDSGNGTIVIGRLDSEVPTALVTQQYVTVDCGFVSVQEQFGNVFDYIGTNISIYLPFIGIIPLNVSDVMRSTLNVKYEVDIFTGACLATIYVKRDGKNAMLYQHTGVCSVEYPLTGGQHSSIINGFFGLMGAGVAMATGPAGTAVAAATGIAASSSIANMARTTNARSGAFGANAGAMGIKKPYLIIERPQTKVATLFPRLAGYPTNYSLKISDCTNQVVVSHVHVDGINATQQELTMIEDLLRTGIVC